jgi:two-component system, NtrC family, response regulator GlrR
MTYPDSDPKAATKATAKSNPRTEVTEADHTDSVEQNSTEASLERFHLRIMEGPDQGMEFHSKTARTTVGTHESVDVRLSDPTVSRFQCEIELIEDSIVLRDLGSRNGTWVAGFGVREIVVRDGVVIQIGRTRIQIERDPSKITVPTSARERFGLVVGQSLAMRQVFALLERTAASQATVLLLGETGTGKEAAAESIHSESERSRGPFVVVDCGAIPANLLESELFGHEKGAFTSAHGTRIGVLEAARGGTLFLDEIGELPQELQSRLLRVLERKEIRRVGSNRYLPIDVRVIAATHRDLRAEVNAKRFRADLYFRLAVLEVRLPALRERLSDLPLLVEAITANLGLHDHKEAKRLREPAFLAELQSHQWPGNVRELRNYLERCVALGGPSPLGDSEFHSNQEDIDVSVPLKTARERWVHVFERRYLTRLLEVHQNNVSAAARATGIDRIHLYRLLWRHGLR